MLDNLKAFWAAFRAAWHAAFNQRPHEGGVQALHDEKRYNLKHAAVIKLNNLTNNEATYEIKIHASCAEPLAPLCKSLEDERYVITEKMLDTGDCFVFPATGADGRLYHSILPQSQVVIAAAEGGHITEGFAILAAEAEGAGVLRLIRHHSLKNGNLTIKYITVNEQGACVYTDKFGGLSGKAVTYFGANHIGFGRYRSPVSARGLSDVYGVGINFKCGKIESDIFETLAQINTEFKRAESRLLANDVLAKEVSSGTDGRSLELMRGVIPVMVGAGERLADQIDIFSPAIRESSYYAKLTKQLEEYEREIGVSKGILTENSVTSQATATEVRRSNADTIAFINRIRAAIERGNADTLTADCVYLSISPKLFSVSADWFDSFDDPAEQWSRLFAAQAAGAVKTERLTRWLFPSMTDEEIKAELSAAGKELRRGALP